MSDRSEDWFPYLPESWPPRNALCQFAREGDIPWVGYPRDFNPYSNIAGLYWRLTGIGKHQKESE